MTLKTIIKRLATTSLFSLPLLLTSLSSSASTEIPLKTKTLFKFYRTNYKPTKVLQYDMITTNDCMFGEELFDPYYLETEDDSRVELDDDSYFIPKEVNLISPNNVRFTFKALENLIGKNGYVDTYVFPTPSTSPSNATCSVFAVIKVQNAYYSVNEIFAKMRVILGRPIGLVNALAKVSLLQPSKSPTVPFNVKDENMELCLYGKSCSR